MTQDPAILLFGAYRRAVLARLLLRPEESVYLREPAPESSSWAAKMTLENLLRIGKLKAHPVDEERVARLLEAADQAVRRR